MNFPKLLHKLTVLVVLVSPLSASALVMRANGPEPIIVQIKESLRTSDDLDTRLNELASANQQNHLTIAKWWAGPKLLVMLNFPSNFSERQATTAISRLQQLGAVEKVVPVSAFNLHFHSGDFIRAYGSSDSIPDVARRGFDADRVGKPPPTAPNALQLLAVPHVPNRLIVGWKEENIWKADSTGFTQTMANLHQQTGCRVVNEFRYSPTKLHQVLEFDDPTALADKLQRYIGSGFVTFAQPDYIYQSTAEPNDPGYSIAPGPWNLWAIHAQDAWNISTGSDSVVIAVGDTGANVNHPDFISNLWSGQNNGEEHNFSYHTTNVDDDFQQYGVYLYHGSNVAAIIGAQGNNGAYMSGVAWDTSLMILKVCDSNGAFRSDTVTSAINYASQHGATAINLSLRGLRAVCQRDGEGNWFCYDTGNDSAISTAVDQARAAGMVIVSAAGNDNGFSLSDGTPLGNLDNDLTSAYPASIATDNNISVMATNIYDNVPSYSNYGAVRVDVAAPGGDANAPVMGLKQTFNGDSSDSSNYSFLDGTSMAAPHVSGVLALIKSRFPWENYLGIRDRLLMGTDHIGALDNLCRTKGRLNAYKALQTRSMLRNLSTRARVEDGERVMAAGFVIGGSSNGPALKVGIRGIGPSLQGFMSVPVLGNPRIELYNSSGQLIDANNNWAEDWNAWTAGGTVESGLQPSNGNEAAMVRWLSPGAYTVVLRDEGTQYGVGVFEIYELQNNTNEQSRLLNLSTRCLVGTGEEEPIAGTIVGDQNNPQAPNRRLLIFAKGPSLGGFGIANPVQDPQLDVLTTGEYNNNWGDLGLVTEKLGAFAPGDYRESALWPTFTPGAYTARLRATNQTSAIGLIEFYEY